MFEAVLDILYENLPGTEVRHVNGVPLLPHDRLLQSVAPETIGNSRLGNRTTALPPYTVGVPI